jgi:hypothetical protein
VNERSAQRRADLVPGTPREVSTVHCRPNRVLLWTDDLPTAAGIVPSAVFAYPSKRDADTLKRSAGFPIPRSLGTIAIR